MSSNINRGGLVAGSRVIVHPDSEARKAEATFAGVVVEDFADEAGMAAEIGRLWAPVRRWAVALDDGRLVFADDDHLKATDCAGPGRSAERYEMSWSPSSQTTA